MTGQFTRELSHGAEILGTIASTSRTILFQIRMISDIRLNTRFTVSMIGWADRKLLLSVSCCRPAEASLQCIKDLGSSAAPAVNGLFCIADAEQ